MKVSIRQISEVTGFSPATVSNALNNKRGVNRNTAAEVFRVAKELGYIPENKITKIRLVIYKRSGGIIDDTPFFKLLIDGVESECKRLGYEMILCNLNRRSDDYEKQVKWLISDTSAGIILLGTEITESDLEIYKKAKCPFLIFDCFDPSMSLDSVLINNTDSARIATEYLISKGHKKIGYLRGDFRIKAFRSRWTGFGQTLESHRLKVNGDYIFTLSTTMEGAYKSMLSILERRPELPTAFFADNDMIALGAMKALQENGYRIPEDISIIGFDDLPFCEIASPRLTTIRVSKQEMGEIAVRRMHEIIQHPNGVKVKIEVCTTFVERDSMRDLRS